MQSKIAHAAERKAFELAIDKIIKSASREDREKAVAHLVGMAEKLLRHTGPRVAEGMRKGLRPGGKWEKWLFDVIEGPRTFCRTKQSRHVPEVGAVLPDGLPS